MGETDREPDPLPSLPVAGVRTKDDSFAPESIISVDFCFCDRAPLVAGEVNCGEGSSEINVVRVLEFCLLAGEDAARGITGLPSGMLGKRSEELLPILLTLRSMVELEGERSQFSEYGCSVPLRVEGSEPLLEEKVLCRDILAMVKNFSFLSVSKKLSIFFCPQDSSFFWFRTCLCPWTVRFFVASDDVCRLPLETLTVMSVKNSQW